MKILKNLFYLILMVGITFLACQAKVKKLSPDEEIRLLKNLVKEKTEAAHAEIEYWQKMGLVGSLIDAQVNEVREKTISPDAFNGLKILKDSLFDLLASSERVGVKRLRERYESAKKALQIYAQDYIEDYVEEVPEAVSTEAVVSASIDEGEEGITMGLPPTPELPPIISSEEKEEIIAVKEEEMKVKPEMFEIPPTPPSPGAPGMPAAPGMVPSEMGMGMQVAPVPEMGMGMMPEAPVTMGMEGGMEEMGPSEMGEEEIEEEEAEVPAMGMEPAAPTIPEGMPSAQLAQPSEMGMMPEEVMEEIAEEEFESADAEAMADMEVEEAPSGMALGMESPVLTGLESFERKYKNNINLAMNLLSDDEPNIEDDEEEIQDEEDEEEADE